MMNPRFLTAIEIIEEIARRTATKDGRSCGCRQPFGGESYVCTACLLRELLDRAQCDNSRTPN